MATVKISTFGGTVPAVDDRLLPENNAAFARNVWLYSGALQGFRTQRSVRTLANSSSCSVFRLPNSLSDGPHISDSYWLEFGSSFVDAMRTAVVGDQYERYYWAQQTAAPRYNTKARIKAGLPSYLLGVPAPPSTLTVTPQVANADQLTETRSYVVTWVTEYGEEGPPCDPVTVSGWSGGTWVVGGMYPSSYTDRNITRKRIYRTVTSSQGVASYFFVTELANSATSYADTNLSTTITSNNQLASATWFGPPADLQGWVSMPNGIIAGWSGKEVWFCEPYRPHAWPSEYTVSSDYNIVGLGVQGQTLIVCTEGYPTAITGINPASMSMAKVTTFEPCTSRGSIVSTPEGVYYASPNGLIRAANGSFVNVTQGAITKDKWQNLLRLQYLQAARLGTGYYVFGVGAFGGFATTAFANSAFAMDDFSGAYSGLFIDPSNPQVTTTLCSDTPVLKVFNDPWSGELMIIKDGQVYWVDVQSSDLALRPYIWRSKIFQSNLPENFEAIKVYFDPAASGTLSATGCSALTGNTLGVIRVYADNNLVFTRELVTSGDQFRLPSGFKAQFWQIEIEARVKVYSVQMATSAKELRDV